MPGKKVMNGCGRGSISSSAPKAQAFSVEIQVTISSDHALDKSVDPPDGAPVSAGVAFTALTGVTQVVVASTLSSAPTERGGKA